MTPQYIDLQVNGYGGHDYNQEGLTAEQFHTSCELLREHGVAKILATITTEKLDVMCRRLQRIVDYRKADKLAQEIIVGFHIEGPFISPETGYVGAHPKDSVQPATVDAMKRLLDATDGMTRLVTLAPEHDAGFATTKFLRKSGVVVSAGHCNPTVEQLSASIDAGITLFTHLGNGCPMQMHRHDNIIQRALSLVDRGLMPMFIADGAHVPFVALGNYLKLAGVERCIVVTDAVAPAGKGPGKYTMGRWELVIGEDLVARAPDGSHFVGSALMMPRVVDNLKQKLGLSDAQVRTLIVDNPKKVVGL